MWALLPHFTKQSQMDSFRASRERLVPGAESHKLPCYPPAFHLERLCSCPGQLWSWMACTADAAHSLALTQTTQASAMKGCHWNVAPIQPRAGHHLWSHDNNFNTRGGLQYRECIKSALSYHRAGENWGSRRWVCLPWFERVRWTEGNSPWNITLRETWTIPADFWLISTSPDPGW